MRKLRRSFHEINKAPAGERFRRYHYRRRGRHHPWLRPLILIAGILLVVLGFLLSLPPLVPGFLLWVPGLALIASQSILTASFLDSSERWLRRWYRRLSGNGNNS